jgi:class 3 adenylate cyclase/tetratricopeptide (TPR) repeat protein
MICSACSQDTPDAGRFCINCGTPMVLACPTCGSELVAGKPFCAECGTRVLEAAGTPTSRGSRPAPADHPEGPADPVAERRLCSVLFVDLVGFTPFAEHRDPEEVRELLSRYFEASQSIVESYGGTLEKFIGDAVTALWGAPVADEDDAELAVRAALEIVEAVASLGRVASIPELEARAGVVTGEAAVTIGRVAEGMVLGDTVNTAARVQTAAAPGSVYVDESTWRAASRAIAFEEVGELSLKGKDTAVRVWRADRVVARRGGRGRTERLEPPFVGRDAELRLLKELLQGAARESRARIVSVSGIPGIGKSRLAWEFLKYVDGLADTYFWHQGRSRSHGEGVAFGALAEMVRMRAGIGEDDDAETSRHKLATCLDEFVPGDAEREWIEPRIAHLLGLAAAQLGERDELFAAWRSFFEHVAERGTAILVFEDLQWADPGLIDFVEELGAVRGRPILVVTLSRPELADQRPTWGAGQRSFSSLHLEPLARDQMRSLLTGFVPGLPDDAVERVLDRSEGVPLYAVETIRMLLDRGILLERNGGIVVEGTLSDLDVPETLHALIASRLDALPAELRRVLQDAAIVGSTFRPETVAVVAGIDAASVRDALIELVRKEMLFVEDDPRSPERGQFSFIQAVMREVAVGMLSRRDRATKHLAVARYAEALVDDELAGMIASQYLEAVRATPADEVDPTVTSLAVEWLQRAANRAKSLGSLREAISMDEEALTLAVDPATRANLWFDLADTAARLAERDRSLAAFAEARALREGIDDVTGAAEVVARVTWLLDREQRRASRLECEAYFEKLGSDGDVAIRAQLAIAIANCCFDVREFEPATTWSELALGLAESEDDDQLFARILGVRSHGLYVQGRHREALLLAEGVRSLADRSGAVREQMNARIGMSLFMLPDDPARTIDTSWEVVELARRGGFVGSEALSLLNNRGDLPRRRSLSRVA